MVKKPFIGQLDRKISIVSFVKAQSSTGNVTNNDQTVCGPWASLLDDSGAESVEGKIVSNISRSYVIRYNQSVAVSGAHYILIDAGERFKITHVEPIGRKSHLRLQVKKDE
ncbi:MAG: hypothetical protein EOO51_12605 [Flavobacterium sp.]|nr:MAG: hypothetical protein EOO51_12605 [Flavobacterium sp.]